MATFDWVTARAECSVNGVFEKLRVQVAEDVEIRHKLRPTGEPLAFQFLSEGRKFSAFVEGNKIHHSVIFNLKDQVITVYTDDDTLILRAEATLNKEGKCVVTINDEECELWQMRKMALEKLFFTDWYTRPE